MKIIYLAGGCFWGVQKFFDQFEGVMSTETGYANGPDSAPTYQDVCNSSGHAETVRNFFSAEEYHQKYLDKNPGGYCHIPAKYFSLKQ